MLPHTLYVIQSEESGLVCSKWSAHGLEATHDVRSMSYAGVAVTKREAVLPDFAKDLERPGFGSKEQQKKVKGKARAK